MCGLPGRYRAGRYRCAGSSYQLTLPNNNRAFLTESDGYSLYSNLQWQAGASTFFDLMLDYHENESQSETRRRGTLVGQRHHADRLVYAEARGQSELFSLPGGAVQAVAGVQYRREVLRTDAKAFFPLIGEHQHIPGVRSLVVSAAARHEDFGAPMGSKVAPKVGVATHRGSCRH